jgi:hypothetical protein
MARVDNYKEWGLNLAKVPGLSVEAMNNFKRALGLEALKRVVQRSPVDTGRFRANWQLSVGAPAHGEVEGEFDAGVGGGARVVHEQGAALARVAPGQDVYLANNLPYAGALEDGHSGQAPEGMVALTVQELQHVQPFDPATR